MTRLYIEFSIIVRSKIFILKKSPLIEDLNKIINNKIEHQPTLHKKGLSTFFHDLWFDEVNTDLICCLIYLLVCARDRLVQDTSETICHRVSSKWWSKIKLPPKFFCTLQEHSHPVLLLHRLTFF